jgi:mannose/cellobiose epimerase-like protein (N-acyl-D-glucosamine 2-epimerase family)
MLYTFSHAHWMTRENWARMAAERALDFMRRRLKRQDGAFVTAASPEERGSRVDLVDFYDQAFVLFGLAWWHRSTGDPEALSLARATLASLDRLLKDPIHGGWREAIKQDGLRRQNPHMHLLEAMLAWFEFTGDEAWLAPAREVVRLFHARFFDAETGTLREFFADDLSPAPAPVGHAREPGHHFEWVWLLLHYRRLTGDDTVLEPAERLFDTARRYGVDGDGLAVEVINPYGKVLDPSRLLWPQTEAVKAALARAEFLGADPAEADTFLSAMVRVHFPTHGPLWINRVSPRGERLTQNVPTRVLYHLTLCIAEYARLRRPVDSSASATE